MKQPEKTNVDHSREEELIARLDEPFQNYQLLREGVQGFLFSEEYKKSYERNDTHAILQMYVACTDAVIGVADGSISKRSLYDPRNHERSAQAPDEIIFLDKSARPVSWFMDAFWEQFAKEGVEKPRFDFLNIDRTNWFMKQGYVKGISERFLKPSDFDINKVSEEDIARIRALFVEGELSEDSWMDKVWDMPTRLDGKNILIIDEVKNQGGTLSIATQLLRRAIPDSVVSGEYFWQPKRKLLDEKKQESLIDSVPVWYDSKDPMGREVGDPSVAYWDKQYEQDPSQENLKRKIGWTVLSAPHFDLQTFALIEDEKAKTLKQDIAYLSYAVAAGRVLRQPSGSRTDEDFDDIVEKQDVSIDEIYEWGRKSKLIKHRQENKTR